MNNNTVLKKFFFSLDISLYGIFYQLGKELKVFLDARSITWVNKTNQSWMLPFKLVPRIFPSGGKNIFGWQTAIPKIILPVFPHACPACTLHKLSGCSCEVTEWVLRGAFLERSAVSPSGGRCSEMKAKTKAPIYGSLASLTYETGLRRA